MKTILPFLLTLISSAIFAQNPVIEGDTMLCPNSNGTAYVVNDVAFDSYQWYFKFWFTSDEFEAIDGATSHSFTYDWYTYDQAVFKVVGTLNGESYESNTIQIDSWNWLPISMGFQDSENISINPENGNVNLCEGTSFTVEVFNPFSTNIRWYRDGVAIEGANQMTYEITAAGTYHVTASPGVCPENEASTEGTPFIVEIDEDCDLATPESGLVSFSIMPNPVSDRLTITGSTLIDAIRVYNLAGQEVDVRGLPTNNESLSADVSKLSPGIYLIKVETQKASQIFKFIKK